MARNKDIGTPRKKLRHQFLVVTCIALALVLVGQIIGSLILTYPAMHIQDAGWLFMLDYALFIGIDLIVFLYTYLAEKEIFHTFFSERFGGPPNNSLKMLGYGLLAGFLMNLFCALIAFLAGDLDFSIGSIDVPYLVFALPLIFIQSAAEELVTRGYMLGALRERYGSIAGVLINSLFFAALHLLNPGITVLSLTHIALVGLLCSLVVEYTDSMWFVMALHTAWNYTQNILLGLPNSGIVSPRSLLHLEAASDSILYSYEFGIEGGLPGVILYATCSLLLFIYRDEIRNAFGTDKKKRNEVR
jgi:membrane protease YdiL (CAAX protease family)